MSAQDPAGVSGVSVGQRRTRLVARPLALGWALLLGGPLSASAGLLPGMVGFLMFVLGGLTAGAVGVLGAWLVRRAGGPWAPLLGAGLLGLAVVVVPAMGGGSAPPINDISTDTGDPPRIDGGRALDGLGLRFEYDPSFAPITAASYPDLAPQVVDAAPDQALAKGVTCLQSLGGRHVMSDEGAGTAQATFVTRVFRFHDDVALRVRPDPAGARLDIRSRSRDGKGDLGTNAARIRAIRECVLGD